MASGTRPTGADLKPVPRVTGEKRYCPVCGDKISSYNPGPNCYQHTIGLPGRGSVPSNRPGS